MSFIVANFNFALSKESENAFKSAVGRAVELIGQSEEYTLLQINESKIYLRGRNDSKVAYILVSIFDSKAHRGYTEFSAKITRICAEILGVSPRDCYIKFDDIGAWAVNSRFIEKF